MCILLTGYGNALCAAIAIRYRFIWHRVGTVAIMVFNLSFAADMGQLYLCEVRVPCISNENNCYLSDHSAKKDENKTVA